MQKFLRGLVQFCAGLVLVVGSFGQTSAQASKDPIKVGAVMSLTGMSFTIATASLQGTQLAIDQLNASGGLLGRQISLVTRDDALSPEKAIGHIKDLVTSEKVDVLLGHGTSAIALAAAKTTRELNVVHLLVCGGGEQALGLYGHSRIFRFFANSHVEAKSFVAFASQQPWKTYFILEPDVEIGHVMTKAFTTEMAIAKPDAKIVGQAFTKLGEANFTAEIARIIATKPEAVFTSLWGADLIAFTKQAMDLKLFEKTTVFGAYWDSDVVTALGKSVPKQGAITIDRAPFHYYADQGYPGAAEFVKEYRTKYKGLPSFWAVISYDAVMMWAQAVRESGTTAADTVSQKLETLKHSGMRGTVFFRPFDHEVNLGMYFGPLSYSEKYDSYVAEPVTYLPGDKLWRSVEQLQEMRRSVGVK